MRIKWFKVRNRANTWLYLMWYYMSSASACVDPGIFTKCVCVGGGVVESPGLPDSKKLRQRCFVIFAVFFSPHLQLI